MSSLASSYSSLFDKNSMYSITQPICSTQISNSQNPMDNKNQYSDLSISPILDASSFHLYPRTSTKIEYSNRSPSLADISPIEELKERKPAPHGDIDFTNASTIPLAGQSVQMNNTNIHHDGSNCQLEHIHNHQLSTINLLTNTDEDLLQKINELNIKFNSKSISLQQYCIEMEKIVVKGQKH